MCPKCYSAYSRVYKTKRVTKSRIRRYRTCQHCYHNFSTNEVVNDKKIKKKSKAEDAEGFYIIDDD